MKKNVVIDKAINCLRLNCDDVFISKAKLLLKEKGIPKLFNECSESEKQKATELCYKNKIYNIHIYFETVLSVDQLEFLKDPFYNNTKYFFDDRKRNWLQTAILYDRDIEILKFLVETLKVDVNHQEASGWNIMHLACRTSFPDSKLSYLIEQNPLLLAGRSDVNLTPLELAYDDKKKFLTILKHPKVDIIELLKLIDDVSNTFRETLSSKIKNFSKVKLWLTLLEKSDEHFMLYVKDDKCFYEKFYLKPEEMVRILRNCHENGQGVFTYIRKNMIQKIEERSRKFVNRSVSRENSTIPLQSSKSESDLSTCSNMFNEIFFNLTGMRIVEVVNSEESFVNSGIFLALMTGRFAIVTQLLKFCQFDIVPYGLLVCLICNRLASKADFSDRVLANMARLKVNCEEYCCEIINSAAKRDMTKKEDHIYDYLTTELDFLAPCNVLRLAHEGRCERFLSLPSCQYTLDRIWTKKNIMRRQRRRELFNAPISSDNDVSLIKQPERVGSLQWWDKRVTKLRAPRIKYFLHTTAHICFLVLFTYVLFDRFHKNLASTEIMCYIYVFGYFLEELRQVYFCMESDFKATYLKASINVVDVSGIVCMLLAFLIRIVTTYPAELSAVQYTINPKLVRFQLLLVRLFLVAALLLFFLRLLEFMSLFQVFGPKLKMFGKMVFRDLLPLLAIFLVFIMAFGIAFQGVLFPKMLDSGSHMIKVARSASSNQSNASARIRYSFFDIIGQAFKRAALTMFEMQYTLDELENPYSDIAHFTVKRAVMYVLLFLYIIVVNVMLMNLLIALFSDTVNDIIQQSKQSWRANRYKVIYNFRQKSILPPPLNVVVFSYELILLLLQLLCCRCCRVSNHDTHQLLGQQLCSSRKEFFFVYQAFALKDRRHKLVELEMDKDHMQRMESRNMLKSLRTLESTISGLTQAVDKKLQTSQDTMLQAVHTLSSELTNIKQLLVQNRQV